MGQRQSFEGARLCRASCRRAVVPWRCRAAPHRSVIRTRAASSRRPRVFSRRNGRSTTVARAASSPTDTLAPDSASRRTRARPIGPSVGESTALLKRPTVCSPRRSSAPGCAGSLQAQAAQMAVGPAPVVETRDRLLADVAALREAHRALVQPRLLGDRALVDVHAVARPAVLDAHDLRGLLGHGLRAALAQRRGQPLGRRRRRRTGRRPCRCGRPASRCRRSRPARSRARRPAGPRRAAMRAASGPISDSRPRSSVRLCSSTRSRP